MTQETIERPKYVTDKMLTYLDNLRESGVTNMYGAAPYVQLAFHVTLDKARKILTYWMKTFSIRHPKDGAQ